jgi:hypothetical protein
VLENPDLANDSETKVVVCRHGFESRHQQKINGKRFEYYSMADKIKAVKWGRLSY